MPNLMTADTGMNEDARKGDMQLWTNVNRHGGLDTVDDNGQGVVSITTKDGTRLSASAKSFMDTFPNFDVSKITRSNKPVPDNGRPEPGPGPNAAPKPDMSGRMESR